ncbi:MAG: haloacid dehalogenase-like hydrolase [Deltaproteobacteria bacterium]|nr:haloacid dehalogenase-like hydrolase [Deltaproteobacteria bacterium]
MSGSLPVAVSVTELLAEISRLEPEPGVARLAAFDADGTLWQGDVGLALFEAAVARRALRSDAATELARALFACGETPSTDLHRNARRLLELYRDDRFGEREVCAMMAWCFAGWAQGELCALAREVLALAGHPGALYEGHRELMAGLRARGIEVLVASGSPRAMVEEACRPFDIPARLVFAMTPELGADGRLLPRMTAPLPYRDGKVEAIRLATGGLRPLVAFGDSQGDLPMLEDAQLAVAVAARPAVLDVARSAPARWRVLSVARTESGHPVIAPGVDRMVV